MWTKTEVDGDYDDDDDDEKEVHEHELVVIHMGKPLMVQQGLSQTDKI